MTSRYMLDTDICSYVIKRSHPLLLGRLSAVPADQVCVSVITKSELLFGVQLSPRRQENEVALSGFLQNIEVLDFPDRAATDYASIRADLRTRGEIIGANDLFIAAHARALELTLVTNNTREFARVRDLKIENWCGA